MEVFRQRPPVANDVAVGRERLDEGVSRQDAAPVEIIDCRARRESRGPGRFPVHDLKDIPTDWNFERRFESLRRCWNLASMTIKWSADELDKLKIIRHGGRPPLGWWDTRRDLEHISCQGIGMTADAQKEAPVQHTGAWGEAELRIVQARSRTVASRPSAHPSSGTETAKASFKRCAPTSRSFTLITAVASHAQQSRSHWSFEETGPTRPSHPTWRKDTNTLPPFLSTWPSCSWFVVFAATNQNCFSRAWLFLLRDAVRPSPGRVQPGVRAGQ